MPKVVRRVINHKYVAVKPDTLQKGTTIPFDCYIRRFDDYVVIIEAGTQITEELYERIVSHDSIYIVKNDAARFREYVGAFRDADPAETKPYLLRSLPDAQSLETTIGKLGSFNERMSFLYETTVHLMQEIFASSEGKLPVEAIRACIEHLARCIEDNTTVMPVVLNMLPDTYTTPHHSTNVAFYAAVLAQAIRLPKEDVRDVAYAALLHDVGKIRIDDKILSKPGTLDDDEYELVRQHPRYGYEIIAENGIGEKNILEGVLYHHEKIDGSGYPKGLHGKVIPKFARIIGMCDVFDALTTRRTFRAAYSSYEALVMMKREMKGQFDERFIDTFISLLRG